MIDPRSWAPRLAPVLAALLAVTVTACGGQTATKQDVIARGNAICASEARDVRAVAPPGSVNSVTDLAPYLKRVVPIVDKVVTSFLALPRPAQDRAALDRFLAALRSDELQYRALAAAAARGDRLGVETALTNLRLSRSATLAQAYGLRQCAGSVGTGVS